MDTLRSLLARPKFLDRADKIIGSFSASGRTVFYLLAALMLISAIGILYIFNRSLQVVVPLRGSTFSEGIIGSPRFINPVLAITDADRDMVSLIYSGLLKAKPSGELVPDLAESYDISSDGRTYTVHVRPGVTFHDGSALTANDVAFTIQMALDPALKSPLRANWQGVAVTVVDPYTITFSLPAPYAPFVNNLTMGILPKHLWQKISAQEFSFSSLNTSPIGSGPYRVAGITKTPAGIATSYSLRAFPNYALGEPYITELYIRFLGSEEALVSAIQNGSVEAGSGISPALLDDVPQSTILRAPLNRVFAVFFNQNNNPALQDLTVRKALSSAIDRSTLVSHVFYGYATAIDGPIPPSLRNQRLVPEGTSTVDRITTARQLLQNDGWTPGADGILEKTVTAGKKSQTTQLSFTLSTSNVPELRAVAEAIAQTWESLGAKVSVQVFESGDLAENVIRPRKYDALLFGEIVGRGLDLFAFWNSSQRNDPGLNIAMYANPAVDTVLEKLRTTIDDATREQLYQQFETSIRKDIPAVFLYAPDFLYVIPNDLKSVEFNTIASPSDRFQTIQTWYRKTDHVWGIFAPTN